MTDYIKKLRYALIILLAIYIIGMAYVFFVAAKQTTSAEGGPSILIGNDYIFPVIAPASTIVKQEVNRKIMVPILMYHYISKAPNKSGLPSLYTEPEIFENQLKTALASGLTPIFAKELNSYLRDGKAIPKKPIVLTFDDGYIDFYQSAFPILKKYNSKAVLYVIVDFMGQPGYVNADQAKEMIDSGLVEIGSHTLSHINLSQANYQEAQRQITESKTALSRALGKEISSFAYPYGLFTSRDEKLVKAAGYGDAVSTYRGTIQGKNTIFSLYRLRPGKKIDGDFIKWLDSEIIKK